MYINGVVSILLSIVQKLLDGLDSSFVHGQFKYLFPTKKTGFIPIIWNADSLYFQCLGDEPSPFIKWHCLRTANVFCFVLFCTARKFEVRSVFRGECSCQLLLRLNDSNIPSLSFQQQRFDYNANKILTEIHVQL